MRNRNLMQKKVDTLESTLTNLRRIVQTQEPLEVYNTNITYALEILEDLRSMIEAEPFSPNELNKF
jgi:hypothetical protein